MSATAKVIVIRREDKTFLNEALKQSIDKVILEQDFKDVDRPLNNFK
jgi:predicted oxidoreductase (fatty acid repression mutant protein)